MKTFSFSVAAAAAIVMAAALAVQASVPAAASNTLHPAIRPLDRTGRAARLTGQPADAVRTCGACHDAAFIGSHDLHRDKKVRVTCFECHLAGGRLPLDEAAYDEAGLLRRERMTVQKPAAEQCGRCHGLVYTGQGAVSFPADLENASPVEPSGLSYPFTQAGGAIYSPQRISSSFLNIASKESLDRPWDAHAGKLLSCTTCHFASNNPARAATRNEAPAHLRTDPRRLSLNEYLRKPDHRLSTSGCRTCHEPLNAHAFLPYKERHLQELECMSCHASSLMGPLVQVIDRTVVTAGGGPRFEYRNLERTEGAALNASYLTGYTPPLFATRADSGRATIAPRNLVTTWQWVAGAKGTPVPDATVRAAYLQDDRYRSDVLAVFDADGDGRIVDRELRLDGDLKIDLVRTNLIALGVSVPQIDGIVDARPVSHGVVGPRSLSRDCSGCHGGNGRLDAPVSLASFAPGGAIPRIATTPTGSAVITGSVDAAAGKDVVLQRGPSPDRHYVLGLSKPALVRWTGPSVFLVALLSVLVHGAMRIRAARRRVAGHGPVQPVYMYPVYERLWHWFMVLGVLVLLVTGFEVHGAFGLLGMPVAVAVHNVFAVLLAVNAFLSLFYHLASAAIHQFLPPSRDLKHHVLNQISFYLGGIFEGKAHPLEKTPERKLNPLQQITYLLLLNVLFPLQIVTGMLIWGVPRWPQLADAIGGLTVIAPLHLLLSWMFLAFLVVHLYLTTTGHTVFSNIKAMVDGYDVVEAPASNAKEVSREQ